MVIPVSVANTSQPHPIEIVAHHEAGHTTMARLFGRIVYEIALFQIPEGTYVGCYNGRTWWGQDSPRRDWDCHVPYNELGLRNGQDADNGVALIHTAGKAAERLWYRQASADDGLASFGAHDEFELELELRTAYKDVWCQSASRWLKRSSRQKNWPSDC